MLCFANSFFFNYKFNIVKVHFKVKHYFKEIKILHLKYQHISFFSEFFYTHKFAKTDVDKEFNVSSLSMEEGSNTNT